MIYDHKHVKRTYDKMADYEDQKEKQFNLRTEIPREFIKKYIRVIDYNDLSKLIGIKAQDLKEAVEKTGIKLPYERAGKWSDLDVGKFISISVCARCFVQKRHNSFIVGKKNCRKCLEKNIKHWVETDTVINIKLKGTE